MDFAPAVVAAMLGAVRDQIDAAAPNGAVAIFYPAPVMGYPTLPTDPRIVAITLPLPCGSVIDPPADLSTLDPPAVKVLDVDVAGAPQGMVTTSGDIAWGVVLDGAGDEIMRGTAGVAGSGADFELDAISQYAGGYCLLTRMRIIY